MTGKIRMSFGRRTEMLSVDLVLPLRQIPERIRQSSKYKRIARSILEVGIIEPLVVTKARGQRGHYLLLDGHLRLAALKDQGIREVLCLVADDDEAFTYNKRVNRLATVQEHFMIVKALDKGVSEEKLARALNVDPKLIKRRKVLLDGICPEVVDLLKDKPLNPTTFDALRKMRPMRQIEVAELMTISGNYTASYAKSLLAATRQIDLLKPDQPKRVGGLSPEQMAKMEREMESLQQDFKQIEASYGDDVLHLVIASGFVGKLIGNSAIERYLDRHHSEILAEFKSIVSNSSLDQAQNAAS
ncbi:MAG: ParB N-terminal domain-containing protein [Proteobacteria bacterium]|nr:ParB N-terminal domain-containing protein [Pseudomonadota bacterium]